MTRVRAHTSGNHAPDAPPRPDPSAADPSAADRVLIVAPTGRDGEVAVRHLTEAGLRAEACPLTRDELDAGVGALLLTEEALVPSLLKPLTAWLRAQPAWSDPPIILCIDVQRTPEEARRMVRLLEGSASVTVLDRPVRTSTLISVTTAALHARVRQYQVRDLLDRLTKANAQLTELNADLERRVYERTEALHSQTERVHELAAALTFAEQRERTRIAGILHDHLQQLIFGIKLKLELLRSTGDDAKHASLLAQTEELTDHAMAATRTLTVELDPPVLAEDDFALIMEWLASYFEETHDFTVEIVRKQTCEIQARELRTLLTQSVRELLFNAAKHAGVRQASVQLDGDGDDLLIHVEDAGRGFDPDLLTKASREHGFGLYSVRERMRLFGADVTIRAQPGTGTRITIRIPCDAAAKPSSELDFSPASAPGSGEPSTG